MEKTKKEKTPLTKAAKEKPQKPKAKAVSRTVEKQARPRAAAKSAARPKAKPGAGVAAAPVKRPVKKKEPSAPVIHRAAEARPVHSPAAKAEPNAAKEKPVPAQPAQPQPVLKPHAPAAAVTPAPAISRPTAAVEPAKPPQAAPAPAARPAESAVSAPAAPVPPEPTLKELVIELPITVKDLSIKLQEKPSIIIKHLMSIGVMAGINQALAEDAVRTICRKYGCRPCAAPDEEELALGAHAKSDDPGTLKPRFPIVTFMGHVDHGKTSLLDAIRKSKVTESEHGGITQHIGAYKVKFAKGEITFLDTPGHEAFTAMRARGAKATDIVVLVVAADDGLMPQTQEAIDHAQAAQVPIVVALNKVDKPQADLDRVKKQLGAIGLTAEDWGGKTIMVPVSAKTGQGIDALLEMILLEAELLELKANPDRPAKGVVLEAKMVKNKGPVSTLLVQSGSLHLNSNIIVGNFFGKIRAMFNDRGHPVTVARPSDPVEVLGIGGVPQAGEVFFAIEDERQAKELALKRQEKEKQKQMQPVKRMGLEDLYSQIKEGKIKELKMVIKADAGGSLEAITEALGKINSPEVRLLIIHQGVGNINSSDVILAVASDALILGFNVVADEPAKALIDKEGQDVRVYNIIYELVNDIRAALEGMLAPKLKKVFLGKAEIRKVFRLSSGIIAGCFVSKGKIIRSAPVALVRNGKSVFEGELSSLKRFKDDVREVEEGFECGISLKGYHEIMEGDVIEAYQIQKIARTLE